MWAVYLVDVDREVERGCAPGLTVARTDVVPLYGPEHERGDSCWCRPWRDAEAPSVRVHRAPAS